MMKRSIHALRVALNTTFFFLWGIQPVRCSEPHYVGQPLSDWLCCEPRDLEQNAVLQIGTNAIPTLLDILGATDKTVKKVAARLDNKSMQRRVRADDFVIDDFQALAVDGFRILGANADPAIPQIVKLLNSQETSFNAAQALAEVGPNGFAVLTNNLASSPMRGSIVAALGQRRGGDPKIVTKLLINALKDENPGIRANAADFLAGRDPGIAIPALIETLSDKSPDPRRCAAIALGSYGSAAKSAAPKILSLYTNAVDVIIFGALKKIDPKTAAEAETFILSSGPTNADRIGYTKTRLKNGKALIAGGWIRTEILKVTNRCLSNVELIDPAIGKWTETGKLNTAREWHKAVLLNDGKVLAVGGEDAAGEALSSAELYDPNSGRWTETARLNTPHPNLTAVLQRDGKVLVYSERYHGPAFNVEQYDPATERWTIITNLPHTLK
jgi:hypothetical protein